MVTFTLESQEFAVDINQVREVIYKEEVNPLPQAAHFIEGVLDLRGEVIPVVCLRKRFQIPVEKKDEDARILIVEMQGQNSVGLVVDSVTEVLRFTPGDIHPPPSAVAGIRTDLINGVGKIDDRLLLILDLEKLLTSEEMFTLEDIALPQEQKDQQ